MRLRPRGADGQNSRVILRAWFVNAFELQASLKEIVDQAGKRDVPDTDAPAESGAEPWSNVCAVRLAISGEQLWRLLARVTRERAHEARVSAHIQDATARSHYSPSFGDGCTPVIHVGVDERRVDRVERAGGKRRRGGVSLNETADLPPLSCDCELIGRDIQACREPTRLNDGGQVQAATACQLETAPRPWPEPVPDQCCRALREWGQPLVVPACIRVVARLGPHATEGKDRRNERAGHCGRHTPSSADWRCPAPTHQDLAGDLSD